MNSDLTCIFCKKVGRNAKASVIYEDERIMAFMNIRPVNPGESLLITAARVQDT